MALPNKRARISPLHRVVDQVRNEKQKAVLLSEAARLSQQRSSQAVEQSRKLCGQAQDLQSRLRTRKVS